MQSNLKALFKGKVEAVDLPVKRPVGRPKKDAGEPLQVSEELDAQIRALKKEAGGDEKRD